MINEDRYDTKEKLLQGTAQATLHIIDGLDWNLNLSYQNQQYIYNMVIKQIYFIHIQNITIGLS